MLTLALDTTSRTGSVAVTDGDRLLAVIVGDGSRTHGERLPGEIAQALAQARVPAADLQLLTVASGPGAFTGLRIGLAAIQGLAMVVGAPVAGVSALDALAHAAWELQPAHAGPVCAWMDAQRGEVFAAHYAPRADGGVPRSAETAVVGSPAEILAALPADVARQALFIGDGAVRYRDLLGSGAGVLPPPDALAPAIAHLGRLLARSGAAGPPHQLQPLYVRRSDAELARQRHATS